MLEKMHNVQKPSTLHPPRDDSFPVDFQENIHAPDWLISSTIMQFGVFLTSSGLDW